MELHAIRGKYFSKVPTSLVLPPNKHSPTAENFSLTVALYFLFLNNVMAMLYCCEDFCRNNVYANYEYLGIWWLSINVT